MDCNKDSKVAYADGISNIKTSRPLAAKRKSILGGFDGLVISGVLIVVLLIVGAVGIRMFLSARNFAVLFRQIGMTIPVGFAAALTIQTKGLDLSFFAMAGISSLILYHTASPVVGIVLSLIICTLIGSVNAVAIHYLSLPSILVTLATMLICSFTALFFGWGPPKSIDALAWMPFVVFVAVIVALALALLTSRSSAFQKPFWVSVLPVYAGSGILAVLFTIAYIARIEMITFLSPQIYPVVLIGVFLASIRHYQHKTLAIVSSIVPSVMYALFNNICNLAGAGTWFRDVFILVAIVVMIWLIGFHGRAALAGYNMDTPKETLIVLGPILFYLSWRMTGLTGIVFYAVLLLITVGFAVWHLRSKRKYDMQLQIEKQET